MRTSKIAIILFLILQGFNIIQAQEKRVEVEGEVSYISGQNIYVKFETTEGIENGDTLFIRENQKVNPVLLVQHHSSISCLCIPINNREMKTGMKLLAMVQNKIVAVETVQKNKELELEKDVVEHVLSSDKNEQKQVKSDVSGRLSLSSYSNLSNTISENSHRFRYTFTMKADRISDSKISAETYLSFSHKLNDWQAVQENFNSAFKVYNLALKYDFNENTNLWLGRKINPKIANVGAVDGIQFQKSWNSFFAGAVAGTRPDFSDYGFNSDLLEYGAYLGHQSNFKNGFAQSSFAFFEQRNTGNIDRRFLYFQHSSNLFQNLSLFSSFEFDLYKRINDVAENTLSLTSLYLSARYRFTKKMSVFASYDNRKNVIYYETFRNYADEVLQLASRQGIRFRVNYRLAKYINLGVNAGTRFKKEDPRPTKTFRAFASHSRLPYLNASLTVSANLMQTAYLNGQIYGARLSKDFLKGKMYSTLNYRMVNFDYVNTSSQLNQHIAEIDFSYQFNKKLYLSVNFESTFQEKNNYNRIYLNIRKKF